MRTWVQIGLIAGVLVGCSGKSEDDSAGPGDTGTSSPDAVPCAAVADAGLAMTPGNTPDTTAPAIMDMSAPYTIELSADAGGWVRLVLPEAGSYTIHTSFAGVLRGLWTDTGEYPLGIARSNEVCPGDIPEAFTVTVTEPSTFYMQLGPLSAIYFWVYVQPEA